MGTSAYICVIKKLWILLEMETQNFIETRVYLQEMKTAFITMFFINLVLNLYHEQGQDFDYFPIF